MGKHSDQPAVPHGYWQRTRMLSLSLLYILPLLLVYEVGLYLLRPDSANLVGIFVRIVLAQFGPGHTVFNIVVMIVVCVAYVRTHQVGGVEPGYLLLMVFECLGWAIVGVVFAVLFTAVAKQALPTLAVGANPLGLDPASQPYRVALAVVTACGAGVYEELAFRLFLLSALCWLFGKLLHAGEDHPEQKTAVILGVLFSSVLFALAHHVDPSNPIALEPIVFRTAIGFLFGALFLLRGLAVAVYTHTIYDVLVMLHNV